MSLEQFHKETSSGKRFKFGENWRKFLSTINDERIKQAEISLKTMLEVGSWVATNMFFAAQCVTNDCLNY